MNEGTSASMESSSTSSDPVSHATLVTPGQGSASTRSNGYADLRLVPGERVLWQARPGGARGGSNLAILGRSLLGIYLLGSAFFLLTRPDSDPSSLVAPGAVGLLGAAYWILLMRFRARPALFLTDTRLIQRRVLLPPESTPLRYVRSCEDYVDVSYSLYGRREEPTDELLIHLNAAPSIRFGPMADREPIRDVIGALHTPTPPDFAALPAADGSPGTAESRTDLFVSATNVSEGFRYGPLVLTHDHVVRFTSMLPMRVNMDLFALLASARSVLEIDGLLVRFAQRPDVGHVVVAPRHATSIRLEGQRVVVRLGSREEVIVLPPADAERIARFLANRAGPFR